MNGPRRTNTAIGAAILLVCGALAAFSVEPAAEKPALPGVQKDEKTAACPAADASNAPLAGCSAPLDALISAYRDAYKDVQNWAKKQSRRIAAIAEKEEGLKAEIEKNSAEMTKLRFKKSRENKRRTKALKRENKKLWKSLKSVGKKHARLCGQVRKAAGRKVGELSRGIGKRLKQVQGRIE